MLILINKYSQSGFIDRAFTLAHTSGHLEAAYLDIEPSQLDLYQNMTSSILFNSSSRRKFQKLIEDRLKEEAMHTKSYKNCEMVLPPKLSSTIYNSFVE